MLVFVKTWDKKDAINASFCSQIELRLVIQLTPVKFIANVIFTCVANGESRSRSRVTPSVCPSQ